MLAAFPGFIHSLSLLEYVTVAILQGGEGTGMARQDRTRQPSGAEEVKAGANGNDCPICSPLFHDSDREGEDRGLRRQQGEGYLRQGSQARAADWATAPPPSWRA